ncbi:MAG: hypothetical protein IKW01_07015 [Firmicutes bacterium]|nr:hypothetical protein [Bacillota bacterium]
MKELLDRLLEFCSENDTTVAAGAGIFFLVVVAVVFISNKITSTPDEKDREYFLEGEYDSMLKKEAVKTSDEPDEPVCGDILLEELMEESPDEEDLQPVHININIERGQVKIGYDEDGRIMCTVEKEDLTADEGEKAQAPVEAFSGESNIVLEKINLVKAAPVKKFGPDNFNTGRSGRVFTEEELRMQIKD